ncbi:MAG: DUF488 domain-containing protein [Thermomicrobiales bacterium]|nr:DUF488 domain-containing protein [Thermomicrobiales bacterium]
MNIIYTIGHSTRPIDEFIGLLKAHEITKLVDIRTIPKSRHNPQYMQDALKQSLTNAGISYFYLKALGGLRSAAKGSSINDGWRNASFRNYADYMQTSAFAAGIDELLEIASHGVTAIMCAEAVPWRCHRSLVSDALLVRGIPSCEVISATSERPHTLTPFAVVDGTKITYPRSALTEEAAGS